MLGARVVGVLADMLGAPVVGVLGARVSRMHRRGGVTGLRGCILRSAHGHRPDVHAPAFGIL